MEAEVEMDLNNLHKTSDSIQNEAEYYNDMLGTMEITLPNYF